MATPDQNYVQLKFNRHLEASFNNLSYLRDKQVYTDLTLSCCGEFYPAHRLVVSSCSKYLACSLQTIPAFCPYPIILLNGLTKEILEALLTFMYDGQVTVHREHLAEVLKAGQWLGVKGLSQVVADTETGQTENFTPHPQPGDDVHNSSPLAPQESNPAVLHDGEKNIAAAVPSIGEPALSEASVPLEETSLTRATLSCTGKRSSSLRSGTSYVSSIVREKCSPMRKDNTAVCDEFVSVETSNQVSEEPMEVQKDGQENDGEPSISKQSSVYNVHAKRNAMKTRGNYRDGKSGAATPSRIANQEKIQTLPARDSSKLTSQKTPIKKTKHSRKSYRNTRSLQMATGLARARQERIREKRGMKAVEKTASSAKRFKWSDSLPVSEQQTFVTNSSSSTGHSGCSNANSSLSKPQPDESSRRESPRHSSRKIVSKHPVSKPDASELSSSEGIACAESEEVCAGDAVRNVSHNTKLQSPSKNVSSSMKSIVESDKVAIISSVRYAKDLNSSHKDDAQRSTSASKTKSVTNSSKSHNTLKNNSPVLEISNEKASNVTTTPVVEKISDSILPGTLETGTTKQGTEAPLKRKLSHDSDTLSSCERTDVDKGSEKNSSQPLTIVLDDDQSERTRNIPQKSSVKISKSVCKLAKSPEKRAESGEDNGQSSAVHEKDGEADFTLCQTIDLEDTDYISEDVDFVESDDANNSSFEGWSPKIKSSVGTRKLRKVYGSRSRFNKGSKSLARPHRRVVFQSKRATNNPYAKPYLSRRSTRNAIADSPRKTRLSDNNNTTTNISNVNGEVNVGVVFKELQFVQKSSSEKMDEHQLSSADVDKGASSDFKLTQPSNSATAALVSNLQQKRSVTVATVMSPNDKNTTRFSTGSDLKHLHQSPASLDKQSTTPYKLPANESINDTSGNALNIRSSSGMHGASTSMQSSQVTENIVAEERVAGSEKRLISSTPSFKQNENARYSQMISKDCSITAVSKCSSPVSRNSSSYGDEDNITSPRKADHMRTLHVKSLHQKGILGRAPTHLTSSKQIIQGKHMLQQRKGLTMSFVKVGDQSFDRSKKGSPVRKSTALFPASNLSPGRTSSFSSPAGSISIRTPPSSKGINLTGKSGSTSLSGHSAVISPTVGQPLMKTGGNVSSVVSGKVVGVPATTEHASNSSNSSSSSRLAILPVTKSVVRLAVPNQGVLDAGGSAAIRNVKLIDISHSDQKFASSTPTIVSRKDSANLIRSPASQVKCTQSKGNDKPSAEKRTFSSSSGGNVSNQSKHLTDPTEILSRFSNCSAVSISKKPGIETVDLTITSETAEVPARSTGTSMSCVSSPTSSLAGVKLPTLSSVRIPSEVSNEMCASQEGTSSQLWSSKAVTSSSSLSNKIMTLVPTATTRPNHDTSARLTTSASSPHSAYIQHISNFATLDTENNFKSASTNITQKNTENSSASPIVESQLSSESPASNKLRSCGVTTLSTSVTVPKISSIVSGPSSTLSAVVPVSSVVATSALATAVTVGKTATTPAAVQASIKNTLVTQSSSAKTSRVTSSSVQFNNKRATNFLSENTIDLEDRNETLDNNLGIIIVETKSLKSGEKGAAIQTVSSPHSTPAVTTSAGTYKTFLQRSPSGTSTPKTAIQCSRSSSSSSSAATRIVSSITSSVVQKTGNTSADSLSSSANATSTVQIKVSTSSNVSSTIQVKKPQYTSKNTSKTTTDFSSNSQNKQLAKSVPKTPTACSGFVNVSGVTNPIKVISNTEKVTSGNSMSDKLVSRGSSSEKIIAGQSKNSDRSISKVATSSETVPILPSRVEVISSIESSGSGNNNNSAAALLTTTHLDNRKGEEIVILDSTTEQDTPLVPSADVAHISNAASSSKTSQARGRSQRTLLCKICRASFTDSSELFQHTLNHD